MDAFIRKIEDLYKRNISKNIITYTGFLTPAERQIIINKFSFSNLVFFGGIEGAERVRAFFLPDYMDELVGSEYIVAFKAKFSFRELSHRDFLGALLNLGIERRCLGDIYVFDKEAYFFVTKDIAEYIKVNFNKVANVGVSLSEIPFSGVIYMEPSFKEITFTVPSLRIDSVVSGAIKESREKVSTFIKNGAVLLNYLICDEPSKIMCTGDIFSVKGYGKFLLDEVGGESRRKKMFVKVKKYM